MPFNVRPLKLTQPNRLDNRANINTQTKLKFHPTPPFLSLSLSLHSGHQELPRARLPPRPRPPSVPRPRLSCAPASSPRRLGSGTSPSADPGWRSRVRRRERGREGGQARRQWRAWGDDIRGLRSVATSVRQTAPRSLWAATTHVRRMAARGQVVATTDGARCGSFSSGSFPGGGRGGSERRRTVFFLFSFFFLIFKGKQKTASVNRWLIEAPSQKRYSCLPLKIIFARIQKPFFYRGVNFIIRLSIKRPM